MRRLHISVLARISAAHLISHVYIMAIPSLLPLLPAALGVSFVELGAVIGLFSIASAVLQAPMGFVVDRFGAVRVLVCGIAVGTAGCFFLALAPSYAGLLATAGVLGAANAVYHPSDYAILSRSIRDAVMGKAFSIHSFAGFAGSALTPFLMTSVAFWFGISGAFAAAGSLGLLVLLLFFASRQETAAGAPAMAEAGENLAREGAPGEKLAGENTPGENTPGENTAGDQAAAGAGTPVSALPSRAAVFGLPVLMLTVLYIFLSLSTTSIERFSASALIQGYGVSLSLANAALTAFLAFSAIGVLSGGALADRTRHHGYVAALAFSAAAGLTAVTALVLLPPVLLVMLFSLIGFLTGVIVPSRDMLVRAASPKGAEGKVFGIVSCGFNIGGMSGPLLCGYFLDNGMPIAIFWSAVAFMLVTVCLTCLQERKG